METIHNINQDFLVCPMCRQRYKNPKLLSCLHSLCRDCLHANIQECVVQEHMIKKEKEDKEAKRKLNGCGNQELSGEIHANRENGVCFPENGDHIFRMKCPVCGAETSISKSPDEEIKDVASSFTDNFIISGIVAGIDINEVEYCESCFSTGDKKTSAEVWCHICKVAFCDSCVKAHKVIQACREHAVFSLREMRSNPLQFIQATRKELPCPRHKDKILEFYCIDCKSLNCSTCVAINHRRCEAIETCANMIQTFKPDIENLSKDLEIQGECVKELYERHVTEVQELEQNKLEQIGDISLIKKMVHDALCKLEKKIFRELDEKHRHTLEEAKERHSEVDAIKSSLENTSMFLSTLLQFGSNSEILMILDKVKNQINDIKETIRKRKIQKLTTRHKFALDHGIARILEMQSMGKIVDVVDISKDGFTIINGNDVATSPVRRNSVKRTGTFRVERVDTPPSIFTSRNSLSTASQSTSSESMSSQETLHPSPQVRPRTGSVSRRNGHKISVHNSLRSNQRKDGINDNSKSVTLDKRNTTVQKDENTSDERKNAMYGRRSVNPNPDVPKKHDCPNDVKRPPITPRNFGRCSLTERPASASFQRTTAVPSRIRGSLNPPVIKNDNDESTAPHSNDTLATFTEINSCKPSQSCHLPSGAKLLLSFNGKIEGDKKKCWPLDVAVLDDGTPVITDFHNKKVKAFDVMGNCVAHVTLTSWPHGIADVGKSTFAVSLPEIFMITLIEMDAGSMKVQRRIKTSKQYRGICSQILNCSSDSKLIVSNCAANNQCLDILNLEGEILQSFREDGRFPGKPLFTWPYYVATNINGDLMVSDCEAKAGFIYLTPTGQVKYDCLAMELVIQDPRGICTDVGGNVYLADKSAHIVHCISADGKYAKAVVTGKDGLIQPIAVCISPFGHLIVTQDNGDIKVFAIELGATPTLC